MSERLRFVEDVARRAATFSELCFRYGISRKTGYQWWDRFAAEGVIGLEERSRRPKRSPTATSKQVVELLKKTRRRHSRWGPKKLLAVLARKHPELRLPAVSTAARILKQEGLIKVRRRRGRPARLLQQPAGWGMEANELWTADHKGQFRLGDRRLCYPLTLADSYARFVLRVSACGSTAGNEAWPVFESAFREFGLPARILTDNGTPFGSTGIAGLSRLSVWWLKLGVQVERIEPGCPEQNGQHERMHRTLKEEATRPPRASMKAQQRRFDAFRKEYNEERPHEGIGLRTPAELYRASPRLYRKETPGLDYPLLYERRQVRHNGAIKWQGQFVFISELLAGNPVGLHEEGEGVWGVHFGPLIIGRIYAEEGRLRRPSPAGSRRRRKKKVLPMS